MRLIFSHSVKLAQLNTIVNCRSVIDRENFSIRLLEFFLSIPIFSDTIFQLDFCKKKKNFIFFFLF